MQIKEFHKPVTARQINENLAQKFGYKLNLEQFTDVQLEDARNKLRTKLSQFELGESYAGIHESPEYQKTRVMLDCINTEIMEREMEPEEKAKEKDLKKKYDPSGMKKSMQKQYGKDKGKSIYFATIRKKAMKESVPQAWIDSAIARLDLNECDQEELVAELITRYDLRESVANNIVYLAEGEEEKAKIIMATKDMIDRVTGWLEDVAAMKAEQLLELTDSIREIMGSDVAQAYQEEVKPALEAIYTALETSRQGLSAAMATVSGGEKPIMGGSPTLGAEAGAPEVPAGAPEVPAGADIGAGPEGVEGRMKRESVEYSQRLGMLLASKKK